MAETPLDRAHSKMEAAPDDASLRLRFFDLLAGAELFVLLAAEAEGDVISPEVFPIDGVSYVVAFDTEERMAIFTGRMAPYAALSGRALAPLLANQGLCLALNPEVAPSAILLPHGAVVWLAATLSRHPAEVEAHTISVNAPVGIPARLLVAIDEKLASASGFARHAWLVSAAYSDGREGHLLAFVDAVPGAEPGLARAVGEALTFSGVEAGELDVAFFRASDTAVARMAKVGLRFDLPEVEKLGAQTAPGMDPERPPRLR
jgi:hypothetical protein